MSSTIAMGGAVRAHWIGQGKAVPASPITFGDPQLLDDRTANALLIARDRFLREAGPLAERALSEELIRATVEAFDAALVDIANDGSGDAPESVTHAGYSTASTGSSLAQIDSDLGGLVEEMADEDLSTARWCLHPRTAAFLARLRGTGGALAYPGMGVNGGTLLGLPALVSAGVPVSDDSPATTQISLIVGSGIVAAGGEVELRTSKQGTIEMADDPTGDAGTPTAQSKQAVSLFQNNCTALMTIGHINWRARRSTIAATLTGVAY
jgi:HK97 family phage major capsid protein